MLNRYKIYYFILIQFILLFTYSFALSEVKIESVYPTLGRADESLPITIRGEGFDENTKISIYLDSSNNRAIIDKVPLPGSATSLIDNNGIIYVACLDSGVGIIDTRNKSGSVLLDIINTPGEASNLCLNNNRLYVADGSSGLIVYDVTDPHHLKILKEIDIPGNVTSVKVIENIAFISTMEEGVQIIDIENPLLPVTIGSIDIKPVYNLEVKNNVAIICGNKTEFIDLTTPSAPKIIKSFDFRSYQITVFSDTAYISTMSDLILFDISDTFNPKIMSRWDILDNGVYARLAKGENNIIYLNNGDKGIFVLDASSIEKPEIVTFFDTDGYAGDIKINGHIAFVADGKEGLKIIDVRPSSLYTGIQMVYTAGNANSIDVDELNNFYVSVDDNLKVYKSENLTNLTEIGSIYFNNDYKRSNTAKIALQGKTAYIVYPFNGLYIVDISIPSSPILLSFLPIDTCMGAIGLTDTVAYIGDEIHGFTVIDIIDKSNPEIIERWGGGCAAGIFVDGKYAYLSGDLSPTDLGGIHSFDIQIPANPVWLDGKGINEINIAPWDVTVSDGFSYLLHKREVTSLLSGKMEIFDVTIPGSMVLEGEIVLPDIPNKIAVKDKIAYIANDKKGITAIDVEYPNRSLEMGYIHLLGSASDILIQNNIGYSTCGKMGLSVFPLPASAKSANIIDTNTISVSIPAPSIPGHYTIRVYNDTSYDELFGSVTFVPPSQAYLLDTKAILVAGTDHDNQIWNETKKAADYAYQALLYQGYTDESIYYLSPDIAAKDVDNESTLSNVEYAIKEWTKESPPATELLIYLVDHGNDGNFILNSGEEFSVDLLDESLNRLQDSLDVPVTFIYDACQSGSFIPTLSASSKERVIMTSSKASEEAFFLNGGTISFSYQFWDSIMNGDDLYQAFYRGKNQVEKYQTAMLDANSNGNVNEPEDDAIISDRRIGRGYKPITDIPFIYEISAPEQLISETSAAISLKVNQASETSNIERVWGIVEPPDFNPISRDIPVTQLPEIEFIWNPLEEKYIGNYFDFSANGEYKITLCAKNSRGAYALFRQISVQKFPDSIKEVSSHQNLYGDISAEIWASINNSYGNIAGVWAEIIPPIIEAEAFIVNLSDANNDGIYEGFFDSFSYNGVYQIVIYASDWAGHTTIGSKTSITWQGTEIEGDEFEPDDDQIVGASAFLLNGSSSQKHSFHVSDDTDWIKFMGVNSCHYIVQVNNVSPVCNPTISVYNHNFDIVIPNDEKKGEIGDDEFIEFISSNDHIYYLKVNNGSPHLFGNNVTYEINIYRPIASSVAGYIEGTVTDIYGERINNALIWTSGGGSAISGVDGSYQIKDAAGEVILKARADNYYTFEKSVIIEEGQIQLQDIMLMHLGAGDLTDDGEINLLDLILTLKLLAGNSDTIPIKIDSDTDGDRKIGLPEAIWILKEISN